MNACPTLPVAPVTRMRMLMIAPPPAWSCSCLPSSSRCVDAAVGVVRFAANVRLFSNSRSTITAVRMTPPATTFCHSDCPTRFTALNVICRMPAPMNTPNTVPLPPCNEQPPSTAAATACSSNALPSDGVAVGRYAT